MPQVESTRFEVSDADSAARLLWRSSLVAARLSGSFCYQSEDLARWPGAAWVASAASVYAGSSVRAFRVESGRHRGYAFLGVLWASQSRPLRSPPSIKGRNVIFPTISTTIGHLEDFWPIALSRRSDL